MNINLLKRIRTSERSEYETERNVSVSAAESNACSKFGTRLSYLKGQSSQPMKQLLHEAME